jgi:hypothetical protein
MFSIGGLPAGSYFVGATERPGPESSTRPLLFTLPSFTYNPGTTDPAGAQTVRADLGQESTGITFALQPSRLARITGFVADSRGLPAVDAVVTLASAGAGGPVAMGGIFSEVGPDGGFVLSAVPPGVYSLDVRSRSVYEALARKGGPGMGVIRNSPEFASVIVQVTGEDIDNLIVRTDAGFRLSGRLVAEGPAPSLQSVEIRATHVGEASIQTRWLLSGSTRPDSDGSFEFQKLLGPQMIRVSGLPAGWTLERVGIGSVDVTDEGIDVAVDFAGLEVVIARQSEVAGQVTDRRGVPIEGATVVVFAEDRRRWTLPLTRFVRSALSTSSGAFLVAGLPPGRYYAAVMPAVIDGRMSDPDELEPLVSRAARLSLGEGERRRLDLRVE